MSVIDYQSNQHRFNVYVAPAEEINSDLDLMPFAFAQYAERITLEDEVPQPQPLIRQAPPQPEPVKRANIQYVPYDLVPA
jgi:hypothetical protein